MVSLYNIDSKYIVQSTKFFHGIKFFIILIFPFPWHLVQVNNNFITPEPLHMGHCKNLKLTNTRTIAEIISAKIKQPNFPDLCREGGRDARLVVSVASVLVKATLISDGKCNSIRPNATTSCGLFG